MSKDEKAAAAKEELVKVRVEVTAEDIRNGCVARPHLCPVAKALSRVLRHDGVGSDDVILRRRPRYVVPFPDKVANFISAFDGAVTVRPFAFSLTVPVWAVRTSAVPNRKHTVTDLPKRIIVSENK